MEVHPGRGHVILEYYYRINLDHLVKFGRNTLRNRDVVSKQANKHIIFLASRSIGQKRK